MTEERDALLLLSHDVGKYVARAARNLPPTGPIPAALARMLETDLYSLAGGRPASQVFHLLVRGLSARVELDAARQHFARIDALEDRVRAGDEAAQREAARLALDVSDLLSSLIDASRSQREEG